MLKASGVKYLKALLLGEGLLGQLVERAWYLASNSEGPVNGSGTKPLDQGVEGFRD